MSKKTPLRAIRAHCLECANSHLEVRNCPAEDCNLWTFRFGMSITRYSKKKRYADEKKTDLLIGGLKAETLLEKMRGKISMVDRRAHSPEAAGSNPALAISEDSHED